MCTAHLLDRCSDARGRGLVQPHPQGHARGRWSAGVPWGPEAAIVGRPTLACIVQCTGIAPYPSSVLGQSASRGKLRIDLRKSMRMRTSGSSRCAAYANSTSRCTVSRAARMSASSIKPNSHALQSSQIWCHRHNTCVTAEVCAASSCTLRNLTAALGTPNASSA